MGQTKTLLTIATLAVALAACREGGRTDEQQGRQANESATAADAAPSDEAPLALAAADPSLEWGPCPEGMPQGCGIAVLHGDPAKPNADIFLRVPGGSAIPPHAHSSAERMVLVSGEMEVKYQGAPAATLRPGHYAYGPAKRPHQANCRSSGPCILFIAFERPVDVLPVEGELN